MSILSYINPANLTATAYKYIAIAGVVLAISVGSFFYGKHLGDQQSAVVISNYQSKVTSLQNKLDASLLPQQIEVVTRYVTKTIHDKQVGEINHETVQNNVKDVQANATNDVPVSKWLSIGWVLSHDAAARGDAVSSSAAANANPSTFTAPEALTTVTDNYATCQKIRDQVIGLQETINNYNNSIAKVSGNKKK